jgi:hypothetical protein
MYLQEYADPYGYCARIREQYEMEEIQDENRKVWGEDERKNPNKIITIDMNESEHKQLKCK